MSSYEQTKTKKDAYAKIKRSHDSFRKKVVAYGRSQHLSKRNARRLKAIIGLRAYGGPIKASDLDAAKQLSRELVKVVDSYQRASPKKRWFHLTLLADECVISERKPCLMLKQLKAKTDKTLRHLDLAGIATVDVNAMPNHPGKGKGGSLLFHVHVVAFADEHFDLAKAKEKLNGLRTWSSALGGRPAMIMEITKELGKACFWVAYDTKAPFEAKNPRALPDGTIRLMDTEKGLRPQVAMRLIEGFSQMALRDRIFSVGDAKEIREEAMRRLKHWHRARWPDQKPIKDFDARRFWRRFWRGTRIKGYKAWAFFGSTL